MPFVRQIQVGKCQGRPLASVNNVAGQKDENECFLLLITDTSRNEKWLVDGGALLSILPPTPQQRRQGPNEVKLKAANGTDICCYGTETRKIVIGRQSFEFEFCIADVQTRILGADFLAKNYLAPNHRDAQLISLCDYSTLPAEHARGFISNPVNFVHQIDDPYYKLLDRFPEITTPSFTIKEPEHGVEHHIPTSGTPVQSRARRLDPEKLAVAKAELEKLCDLGICYRGKSEWSSPLLVTTKPNGGWRVCGDYRRLNNLTTDDRYPVRSLTDFTTELHGKTIFSKIDLMKGYHQIPVAEPDIKKTAVITPFGLFIFPRTPFGLKNAGQDFQRLMDAILGDLPRIFVYIDDILVASSSMEEHLADLESVFATLSANGLVIQRSKCVLGVPSLEFLGYQVDATGISPLPHRVEAIRATTPPTTVKELQRFLGMVGYYRRFIPKAASHLFHLFEALKGKPKTLNWTPECQMSFEATKEALAKASLLFHPRPGAQLALTTDASNSAVGGVLEQRGPSGWEPLAFYSSKLKPNERMWPPYDRELLGAFKGIRHFRDLIEGRQFTLYTDHQSLIPSLSKKSDPQTARQTYQLSCISEYTTDIRYVQGKANLVADALSRPNEELLGVSSISQQPLQQATTSLTSPELSTMASIPTVNSIPPRTAPSTSSSLEPSAAAVIASEPLVRSKHETATTSVSTSSTCTPSLTSTDQAVLHREASAAKREAARVDLNCVVAAIGDMNIDWVQIASQQPLDPEFQQLRNDERSGLNFQSIDIGRHNLIVDTSNGFPRPYIPFASRRQIFDAFHGLGHPGVERTRKSICAKVVWPSIRQDVSKWARECLACQQAKVTKHVQPPIGEFKVPDRRFQHINVDIVTLPLSNGFKYLLTAVDRFSRWPMAVPMTDMTAERVIDAFSHGWIQYYGVPSTITTDRGTQFSSAIFSQLTKTWGIECLMTTPYHPEANGLVERFHRRMKESLIALGNDSPNDWFWRLPCTMLAIRTTLKPDLGASPADLVYGEGLAVPGEVLPANPATDPELARQRSSALAQLRVEVSRLQPVATSAHRHPRIHLPPDLETCSHVFVRRGGVQSTLASPYVGPFRVISRNAVNFRIAIPGRQNETVAISRVKPALAAVHDLEDAEPPSPPRPGRRPRPPQDPLPPRQNRRRRRPNQIESDDEDDSRPHPQPQQQQPSHSESHPVSPPDSPAAGQNQPESDNEFFGDADPPPPATPNPNRPEGHDWFSPNSSRGSPPPASPPPSPPPPPPPPPSPQPAPPRGRKKKMGNPNWQKGASGKGRRHHRSPEANAITQQLLPSEPRSHLFRNSEVTGHTQLEAPQTHPNEPNMTFYSKDGSSSRRRPDVNALSRLLRQHLDLPDDSPSSSPTSTASPANNFFPPIDYGKSHVDSGIRTPVNKTTSDDADRNAMSDYDRDYPKPR